MTKAGQTETEVLRIMALNHRERLRFWGGAAPWTFGDKALVLPKPGEVRRGHVLVEHGHVRRTPTVLRPCYGEVTAYLRHGEGDPYFSKRSKTWVQPRCMQCPARDACRFIAEERLRVTPRIAAAHVAFERAGGRRAMKNPKGSRSWVAPYQELLVALEEHGAFENINDARIIEHFEGLRQRRLERDRIRKQAERKRAQAAAAKAGQFSGELLDLMHRYRIFYTHRISVARRHSNAPRYLAKTPEDGPKFDAYVWLAREMLTISGRSTKPDTVARQLHSLGFRTDIEINSLRQRVRPSLQRLQRLERLHLAGLGSDAVVSRFNLREALDELEFTPYGLAA